MPVITADQAVELMIKEVKDNFPLDELLEVYNELFPKHRVTEAEARKDTGPLIQKLVEYINNMPVSRLASLWRFIFTTHRNVWYNEEDNCLYFNEEVEALSGE